MVILNNNITTVFTTWKNLEFSGDSFFVGENQGFSWNFIGTHSFLKFYF